MLVNVTFPVSERFMVQCIPELSKSHIFSRAFHLLHSPALSTGLHVFVSNSDYFIARFAAIVVHSAMILVLYLL